MPARLRMISLPVMISLRLPVAETDAGAAALS